jgi:adenosine deaminase
MNRPGIVGVDFSGYPSSQYYSDYEEVFKEIKALGYKITAHLGEVDSPTSIQETK